MNLVIRAMVGSEDWPWINRQVGIIQCEDTQGIVAVDADLGYERVGACVLDNITPTSVQAHFMITSPMVLRHRFLQTCFSHVFNRLGKTVMYGLVPANNEKALRLNKKMGFTEAIRLKGAYTADVDYVLMELRKENCRYLG